MSNKRRALLYLRVSTDRQLQKNISGPTQEKQCTECAHEHGYTVEKKSDIYTDGETGRTADRAALMDMLARCKVDKGIGAVVVYDISRLARNRTDFALIKSELRKVGVVLLSATEPIDESPEGQMLEGVLSTFAEFFSAQSGRKVKASMRHKAETGGWPNSAPYGYRNQKEKIAGGAMRAWIEPHPEEARWVRHAFELFATGRYSVKVLAKMLNREGLPVRKRRNRRTRCFHGSLLERMLTKKIYIGIIEWGGIVNEHSNHEPIIPPELFYRVQDLLRVRSGSTTRTRRHRSLFKGIALCGECGSGMTIDFKETSTTHAIRYLRCRKVQQGKPVRCGQRYFAEEAYTAVVAALLDRVEVPVSGVELLQERITMLLSEEAEVFDRAKADLLRQKEVVDRRMENLLLRSLDEDPRDEQGRSVYERVRSELVQEQERISIERGRLAPRLQRIGQTLEWALAIAHSCRRAFEADEDPDFRGLIVRAVFKALYMEAGTIVNTTLNEPLAFMRRWAAEKPLESLADLASSGPLNETLIEGSENCRSQQVSLANELLELQQKLTPLQEADIETCYRELRGRGLLM